MTNKTSPKTVKKIDGSILEGGGQIIRISVGVSAVQGNDVEIFNIRAGRPKPGLAAQHRTGISIVSLLADAQTEGNVVGSSEVLFMPGGLVGGKFTVNIGTAGACMLVAQAALPGLVFSPQWSELTVMGGTNVPWSPQVDHTAHVLAPLFKDKFRVKINIDCVRRGYYPKGQGEIKVQVDSVSEVLGMEMADRGNVCKVLVCLHGGGKGAQSAVSKMKDALELLLSDKFPSVPVEFEESADKSSACGGSGLVLVAVTDTGCRIAGDCVVSKKFPTPQAMAERAMECLARELDHGGCVDSHMQDQLLTMMALAKGKSRLYIGRDEPTLHTQTAMSVLQQLTDAQFECKDNGEGGFVIECVGVGHQAPTH